MQYCKNCGRQLKDGMRFCDRCGQSVRKAQESSQTARHREIRELQEERLNRKKRLEEKEQKQQRVKEKRRKRNGNRVLIYILVVILIAIASVLLGYKILTGDSQDTQSADNSLVTSTAKPANTPSAASADSYQAITVGNIKCPYPSGFHSGSVSGNEKMSLSDPLGGAKMIIAQEAKSDTPLELAKEYIDDIGAGEQDTMVKGDDWYAVTATVNGTVHHRKCIVRNGLAVYYDFTYSESSGSAATYKGYIDEIDRNFK